MLSLMVSPVHPSSFQGSSRKRDGSWLIWEGNKTALSTKRTPWTVILNKLKKGSLPGYLWKPIFDINSSFSDLIRSLFHPLNLHKLFQWVGDIRGKQVLFHFNCIKENLGESSTKPKKLFPEWAYFSVSQITLCSVQTKTTLRIQFTCLQYTMFLAYFPQEMGLTYVIVLFIYLYAITPTLITFERVGQFQPNLTER